MNIPPTFKEEEVEVLALSKMQHKPTLSHDKAIEKVRCELAQTIPDIILNKTINVA